MSYSARCPAQAIGRDVVNKAREDRMFVLPHFPALLQLYSLFTGQEPLQYRSEDKIMLASPYFLQM